MIGKTVPWLFGVIAFYVLLANNECNGQFLRVSGREFFYGDQKVFLSGANIAWVYYGWDFGNGMYDSTSERLEQWIRDISSNGGNSLRIWVHVEGDNTPEFNDDGFVTAPDSTGDLIPDLRRFCDLAAQYNVFVILSLWTGASIRQDNKYYLLMEDRRLQSYIDNALVPMVQGLMDKPALAAWEIVNEPEGNVLIESNSEPCYDTTRLMWVGGGGRNVPMERILRFINRQAAAIRRVDRKALVTVGSISEIANTDAFPPATFNYYSQRCLERAGGEPLGSLSFVQIHSFSWGGSFSPTSPFVLNSAFDYQLQRPVVIGAFSSVCGQDFGIDRLWTSAYNNSFAGAWSWKYNLDMITCQDTQESQNQGMRAIRDWPGVPIVIN